MKTFLWLILKLSHWSLIWLHRGIKGHKDVILNLSRMGHSEIVIIWYKNRRNNTYATKWPSSTWLQFKLSLKFLLKKGHRFHRSGKIGEIWLHTAPWWCQKVPYFTDKHLPQSPASVLWANLAFSILYFDSNSNWVMFIFDLEFAIILQIPLISPKSFWISISIIIRKL